MKVAIDGKVVDVVVSAEEIAKQQAEERKQLQSMDYGVLVENLIRRKYSLSAELAILRQRYTKLEEFDEYNTYAEQCKAEAKEMLQGGEK